VRATLQRYSHFGLDDVLTGRVSVDEAWTVLMHAPRDSPVISAIADDPAYAVQPGKKAAPLKLAQFSPERESLAGIHDLLASLLATVTVLGGGKAPKVRPHPRPRTVSQRRAQRAEAEMARTQHEDLCRQLLRPPDRRAREVRDEAGMSEVPDSGQPEESRLTWPNLVDPAWGAASPVNLQLAHLYCNILKGDKVAMS
jgi:hypothetical protein